MRTPGDPGVLKQAYHQRRVAPGTSAVPQTPAGRTLHGEDLDALAQARAEGRDPAHGGQARQKRSTAISRRNQEALDWDREYEQPDPYVFRRDILSGLRSRPIRELMAATGLSHPYCAMIRRGAYVSHPRHWQALSRLVERRYGLGLHEGA